MGAHNDSGYGVLGYYGRQYRAHRLMWEVTHGPIPEGMKVCHHCDNPGCVNPDHLFIGTQRDNMADMDRKGRRAPPPWTGRGDRQRGELNPSAKLTADDVREIRRLRAEGVDANEIGRRFGLHRQSVYRLANRRRWEHLD